MKPYDVVVVGGRVAGASTAMLLARAGLRVAVVERGSVDREPVSTHALMRAGVLQLARWGVLDDVVRARTPPVRTTVFRYPDGDRVSVSIRGTHGVDALYAPRRTVLDRLLLDRAEEAGADVYRHADAVSLTWAEGRVAGAVVRGPSGDTELSADLVVGADGLRSTVARLVDATTLRRGRSSSAVLYRYVRGLDVTGYEWSYGDHAAAGLIPTNDDATCVFVATTPDRMRVARRAGHEAAFTELLGSAAAGLDEYVASATGSDRLRGWRGEVGHVRRSWGPGWALVGDAGYYKDPITSHGITDALRDAELLADAVLVGYAAPGPAGRRAMAAYQRTRDRLSRALWDATEEVAGYAWDAQRARTLIRSVSAAMSDEVEHLSRLPDPHRAWLGAEGPAEADDTSVA